MNSLNTTALLLTLLTIALSVHPGKYSQNTQTLLSYPITFF